MTTTDIEQRLAAFTTPDFWFDPAPHAYFYGEQPLTSWSKWIERYLTPFPELAAAKASASKRGITPEEVLADWQWSRDLGTLVHAWIEKWYQTNPNAAGVRLLALPDQPEVRARCQKFLHLHKLRLSEITPLAMELQAHHAVAGVAGTLDFIGQHPARHGVIVADYKTNSKFDRNSEVNRFTKKMLGPLSDLWDNHETKYSLQNSFYRVLLEEAGIPTATGALIWLPPGDAPAEIIQALDFRQRIRSLLFN